MNVAFDMDKVYILLEAYKPDRLGGEKCRVSQFGTNSIYAMD